MSAKAQWPDVRSIWIVMKKEFLDSVRNKWIFAISTIFIVATLVVSYFGAAGAGKTGFQGLPDTAVSLLAVGTMVIPILALMLSYASIAGEREQGSLTLLLSMPITRLEAILGKFLGLASVMVVSILAGLGISGLVVAAVAGPGGWDKFVVFLLGSILFALAFLGIGLFLSTIAKKRSTALGLAVLVWFLFGMIYDTVLFGIYVAGGGSVDFSDVLEMPDWFFAAALVGPMECYQMFAMAAFGINSAFGFRVVYPGFVSVGTTLLSIFAWTVVPLAMALWRFPRQDL